MVKTEERQHSDPKREPSSSSISPTRLSWYGQLRENGIHYRDVIGKGTYSAVKLAFDDHLQKLVAVKEVDKRSRSDFVRRFLPREMDIVRRLKHPNVVQVYAIVESQSFVAIVEEYASNGDLLQKIKRTHRVSEDEGRFIFRQIIEALMYLKSIEVAHRDLKCENVFMDAYDNVKLGDFGFARYMRPNDQSRTFCGSRAYVAPEILRTQTYSGFTADVWSAGIVLYVMVTGLMPYDDRHPKKMLERQLERRLRFSSRLPLSSDVKLLIFEILHPTPSLRPSYEQIIQSAWLYNTPYRMKTRSWNNHQTHSSSSGEDDEYIDRKNY